MTNQHAFTETDVLNGEFFPVYSINAPQLDQLKLSAAINLWNNEPSRLSTNKTREVNNFEYIIGRETEKIVATTAS